MDIERISLPAGWRWGSLEEVITSVQAGFATSERARDGEIQLRTNNISRAGTIDFEDLLRVPAPDNASQFDLSPGDIIFNNTNSQELVGKTAIFQGFPQRVFWSNHLSRIRVDREIADPVWVGRWLHHLWQTKLFSELATRWIGQAAVQKDKLFPLPIPIAPIGEQRRIVAALKERHVSVAAACASAELQVRETEALSQRVVAETIGPGIRLPEDQTVASRGWRWRELSEVAQLESGHTPSRRVPQWWSGDVPWLALPDIRELDGKTAYATTESTNADGLANSSARLLPAGTVCLSRTASVGFVTILGKPMATSQDFVNWICGSGLDPWFLVRALIASRAYLVSLASGAIHKTIYVPTVKALTICLPSEDSAQAAIVKALAERTAALSGVRAVARGQLEQLRALEPALLRAAFSGAL